MMQSKSKSLFILLGMVMISLMAFQTKKDSTAVSSKSDWPPLVKTKYEERINVFMNAQRKRCREDLLKKAEQYVDSTIISEINFRLLDTIIFPEKPIRPAFPSDIKLNDSIIAKPLFDN